MQTAATTTISLTAPLGFVGAGLLIEGPGPTAALIMVAGTAITGAALTGHHPATAAPHSDAPSRNLVAR